MLIKNAILTALTTILIICAISVGITLFRSDLNWTSWLETCWFVSMGFVFLGYLLRGGPPASRNMEMDLAIRQVTLDPKTFEEIDAQDAVRGVAFGWVVMLSSLAVFGLSLAILVNTYN